MKSRFSYIAILGALFIFAGCKALEVATKVGTSVGVATGTISSDQAQSIERSSAAVGKAIEKLTPENEYYIGRAVAANILQGYKPYANDRINRYVNLVGQSLAAVSDRPETFAGGYRFLVLDSDEINAFAAPGGFVMVTRGMLRCCADEEALAAVLAHEIGHVQLEHGLRAINQSRWTTAGTVLGTEAMKNLAGEQLAQLTREFEGSIGDITGKLVNNGYARKLEREADVAAVLLMERLGYDADGLSDMLGAMARNWKADGPGFMRTHPSPRDRLNDIAPALAGAAPSAPTARAARARRFAAAMKEL